MSTWVVKADLIYRKLRFKVGRICGNNNSDNLHNRNYIQKG